MSMLFNCFVALVIIGVIVGVLVLLLAMVDPNNDPDEKKSPYIMQYGETHRAYIVMPPEALYAEQWPEHMTSCQVVFIRKPKLPDEDQRLRTIGQRLLTFQASENASKEERILANVFKSEIGYFSPLRIPDRITDGVEAYTVGVKMNKRTWPADWVPVPFFDIKVVFEAPHDGARRANHVIPDKYRTSAV